MIIAIIPLIPVAYAAGGLVLGGVTGWLRGKRKKKKEQKFQEEILKELQTIKKTQKKQEKDIKEVKDNTAVEEDDEELDNTPVPLPTSSVPDKVLNKVKKSKKDDIIECGGDERFDRLDL